MEREMITVETRVRAPVAAVWDAYTSPDSIRRWNFASDDWHCPAASVDLREGGSFSMRMEAKDGSMGFDFAGTYTTVVPHQRLDYAFGDRRAGVAFLAEGEGTLVRASFDPETEHSLDQQRDGWQAILDNFRRHVEGSGR